MSSGSGSNIEQTTSGWVMCCSCYSLSRSLSLSMQRASAFGPALSESEVLKTYRNGEDLMKASLMIYDEMWTAIKIHLTC